MKRFRRSTGFSFFEQVVHELYVAARPRLRNPNQRDETINHLFQYKNTIVSRAFRLVTAFVVAAIAISTMSDGDRLHLQIATLKLSLPEIYFVFAASLVWIALVKSDIEIRIVGCVISYIVNARFHNDRFAEVRTIFLGNKELELVSPLRVKHFFKVMPREQVFIKSAYILLVIGLSTPVVFAFFTVLFRAVILIFSNGGAYLQMPLAIASVLILPLTLVYYGLFVRLNPIEKDQMQIRWGFLSHVIPPEQRPIFQLDRWTKDFERLE
ncbi:hypothetical protein [Roseobacter litoralis]|uniref:Uncharacterized protein n=1 Tax=Roseobacter litoralis (strain ATCC 49566 / DSM 6996 / JCM 21268 / NBRC 15278 / OCh 149) TaxID=391595 RepID=F7ZCH4_ROSLO|nr:hypothetical protein [Roseobacter litoralis]AEI93205.1 hypothetical protein RLO149_c012010 [Roseobacter litoralis Och 149]